MPLIDPDIFNKDCQGVKGIGTAVNFVFKHLRTNHRRGAIFHLSQEFGKVGQQKCAA